MNETILPAPASACTSTAAEPYINKPEVGRRLVLKPRTVDDWMKRGLLPYYKVGRAVRFRWSEIQNALAQTSRVCRRTAKGGHRV